MALLHSMSVSTGMLNDFCENSHYIQCLSVYTRLNVLTVLLC